MLIEDALFAEIWKSLIPFSMHDSFQNFLDGKEIDGSILNLLDQKPVLRKLVLKTFQHDDKTKKIAAVLNISTNDRIKAINDNRLPVERLAIIQESGIQLYSGRYEGHIVELIPNCFNEAETMEFAKQWCAKKNRHTDLPYYISKAQVKLYGGMEEYTDKKLIAEGIKPLEES